jgi:hypothetical protein
VKLTIGSAAGLDPENAARPLSELTIAIPTAMLVSIPPNR